MAALAGLLAALQLSMQIALSFGWATRPALKGVLSLLGFPPPSSLTDALLLVVPLLVCMVAAAVRVQASRRRGTELGSKGRVCMWIWECVCVCVGEIERGGGLMCVYGY